MKRSDLMRLVNLDRASVANRLAEPGGDKARAAPALTNREMRRGDLENRVHDEAVGRLANRWSDAARQASILARQAKASARAADPASRPVAAGEVKASGSPAGFAPDRSPPQEGTVINAGGHISIMRGGTFVRIGSTKVLCVFPDGSLGVKVGGLAYPIGKRMDRGLGVDGLFLVKGADGKIYVDCGKALMSLDDGKMRVKKNYTPPAGRIVLHHPDPFGQGGVPIPPDPPDISRRRDIQV